MTDSELLRRLGKVAMADILGRVRALSIRAERLEAALL